MKELLFDLVYCSRGEFFLKHPVAMILPTILLAVVCIVLTWYLHKK